MKPSLSLRLAALAAALLLGAPRAQAQAPRVVEITAHRFEFTPSEITLERGQTTTLRLHSQDVTHGFFMRALGIDAIIERDKVIDVPVTPAEPGRYTVICDHFCGAGHGNMKMTIVVR
jgi:cytochrome c oxidase subunit 2